MSKVLIIKLGAAGDVVRTTPVMNLLVGDEVDWIVSHSNMLLLGNCGARALLHPAQIVEAGTYDLVISLEEDHELLSKIFEPLRFKQLIGAFPTMRGDVHYTSEMREWYDMSLISTYGLVEANRLKLANRRSYQEILFEALGHSFCAEKYILPTAIATDLRGDVALVTSAGDKWPNKHWKHWPSLASRLREICTVNALPLRDSVLEHLGDLTNHRIIITPDSLPLHLGLGLKTPTFGIFNCTSPWEIYPYQYLHPLISPCLAKYYYQTTFIEEATTSVPLRSVCDAVMSVLLRTTT